MRTEESWKRYKNALQKVKQLRGLYRHLTVFILGMLFLFILGPMVPEFLQDQGLRDKGLLAWVAWAIRILPLLWAPVMLLHLIGIFGNAGWSFLRKFNPAFLRNWEEKQLRKTLEDMKQTEEHKPRT